MEGKKKKEFGGMRCVSSPALETVETDKYLDL